MSKWPFSLDLLPLQGISDPTMTVEIARGRLVNTLAILDGVLQMPCGLPGDLKQAIYNVRFHVVSGLGLIDGALQLGFSYLQPACDVEGLYDSIDNHIRELSKTKLIWNSWKRSEALQGYNGLLDEMSKPARTSDYIASAGVYGASRIPSMFGGMMDRPSLFHGDEPNRNIQVLLPLATIAMLLIWSME